MGNAFEADLVAFIKNVCEKNNIQVECGPFQDSKIDVLFSKLKLALIFNRLQESASWKNSTFQSSESFKDENIRVVLICEDQWRYEQAKIKSKIRSLLGVTKRIHGRETILIKLNNTQLLEFLKNNHLNTPIKAKYKFGLIRNEELVAVISFSKGRKIEREGEEYDSYELLRFCNKLNVTVVGGFSKLLNHFIINQNPEDIMTYVDADWSHGDFMKKLGFEYVEHKQSIEFWLNLETGEREYSHMALQKHEKPMDCLKDEKEKRNFLERNNYIKIYNSGSYKYLLKLK